MIANTRGVVVTGLGPSVWMTTTCALVALLVARKAIPGAFGCPLRGRRCAGGDGGGTGSSVCSSSGGRPDCAPSVESGRAVVRWRGVNCESVVGVSPGSTERTLGMLGKVIAGITTEEPSTQSCWSEKRCPSGGVDCSLSRFLFRPHCIAKSPARYRSQKSQATVTVPHPSHVQRATLRISRLRFEGNSWVPK
jgi:hypothetical protein